MKIAFLIGSVNRGGTETLLMDVFQKAYLVPFEMALLHRNSGSMEQEFHTLNRVPAYKLGPSKGLYFTYLWKLRQLLKHEKVQVIHAQFWLDCVYARLATIGMHTPIVLTFHGYFLKRGLRALPIRMAIRMADKVCFVSDSENKAFVDYYGNLLKGKSEIIYNGIDFDKFDNALQLTDELPKHYINSDPVVRMVMVGNFVRGRDQQFLCKALNKLHDKGVKFEMYFVGRKSEMDPWRFEECEKLCADMPEVHFLGARNDVPTILKSMDMCIYCTHHDTFGIAILEPISVGVPTIVNDYVVAKEITQDGEWATLYKTGDLEDAMRQIEDAIGHIEQYKIRAKENALKVREKYSIEHHIQHLENIYESLIY